jgi:formylglycine-generating enzyme required for sulfatase activity
MAWNQRLTALRDLLADLYYTQEQARRVVDEAGLKPAFIDMEGDSITRWHNILREADRCDKIAAIVQVAYGEYPENDWLAAAAKSDDNCMLLDKPRFERKPFEPETVWIAGGAFLRDNADPAAAEQPPQSIDLADFYIGRQPVTMGEYAAFLRDRPEHPEPPQGWFNRRPRADAMKDHPVTDVDWHDATAYCAWLSASTGRRYMLPSEEEWECMCRTLETANMLQEAPKAVQQWTRSLWGTQPAKPDPYNSIDEREITDPAKLPPLGRMVHRGGSSNTPPADLPCTPRGNALSTSRVSWRGFRVVMRLENTP